SCAAPAKEAVHHAFFAMDTYMELTAYGEEALLTECEAIVTGLEAELSVTRPETAVARLNTTGAATLSDRAANLLRAALAISRRTGGALDLTIYPVVRAWGFTTGEHRVPPAEERAALVEKVDYTKISLDGNAVSLPAGFELDFGGVTKGYAADLMAAHLRENGVRSALLNLGGNVQCVGAKPDGSPWRVAVQNPTGSGYLCVLSVSDCAVVTSGGYERYFEEDGEVYWHIMDPETAAPAHAGLISVTIVTSSGLLADGLSTSLFVLGLEEAATLWRESGDFEAIFVTEAGEVYITEGLEERYTAASADYPTYEVLRRG
ncbi:MAG: FAD:protein FMN transferase, partial [bacterium]